MRISFRPAGAHMLIPVELPFASCDYVVAPSEVICSACKSKRTHLQGRFSTRHFDHDTHYSNVYCECGEFLGELQAKVDTIFGIEEDERVLLGRPRVY